MTLRRYSSDLTLENGTYLATNETIRLIRRAVENGDIPATERVLKEGERLDNIAGRTYGDGALWWVIAAASGIGWWLQTPPGTLIKIPTDLSYLKSILG
jgi:nucleoid-associated protein YgaU